jgi:curved DNA-binding protein CbpA
MVWWWSTLLWCSIGCVAFEGDPYKILGVKKTASQGEIKQAYRQKARETHPDKNPDAPEDLFRDVASAHKLLSDPRARRNYDQELMFQHQHAQGGVNRGHRQQRTFAFRQNGRTYLFTEDEMNSRFGSSAQEEPHATSTSLTSILKHALLFFGVWFFLRSYSTSSNEENASPDGSAKPAQPKRENPVSTPVDVASVHAPHVFNYDPRFLKQRARRCVIFFPRHSENPLEWQVFEAIALHFITDRFSFVKIDLARNPQWSQFLRDEFPEEERTPLACVFGSSGAKVSRLHSPCGTRARMNPSRISPFLCIFFFYQVAHFTPTIADMNSITPLGPLKDQISRWLENILEGTSSFRQVTNDLPI